MSNGIRLIFLLKYVICPVYPEIAQCLWISMEICGFWQEDLECEQLTVVAVTKVKGSCFSYPFMDHLRINRMCYSFNGKIVKLKRHFLHLGVAIEITLIMLLNIPLHSTILLSMPSMYKVCTQLTAAHKEHRWCFIPTSRSSIQQRYNRFIRLNFVNSLDSHWSGRCLCFYLSICDLTQPHCDCAYKVSSQFFVIHSNVYVHVLYCQFPIHRILAWVRLSKRYFEYQTPWTDAGCVWNASKK